MLWLKWQGWPVKYIWRKSGLERFLSYLIPSYTFMKLLFIWFLCFKLCRLQLNILDIFRWPPVKQTWLMERPKHKKLGRRDWQSVWLVRLRHNWPISSVGSTGVESQGPRVRSCSGGNIIDDSYPGEYWRKRILYSQISRNIATDFKLTKSHHFSK